MDEVFILGGGVAGLTAAHELSERGFKVSVFEQHAICGGKARSMSYAGSGTAGRQDLPGEHGFRFFPGFYWHTTDTMKRIWIDRLNNQRVVDNLVPGEKIGIAQAGKPVFRLEANPPTNLLEWVQAIREILENPSLGVPLAEARVFLGKLFCFLGSGPTRRAQQLEQTSWWEFVEATGKSPAYQNILARGLSRSLVAMRPERASTLTVGSMLVQILINIVDPPGPNADADRVLNAPTNDAWIDPWVAQLESSGVSVHRQHTAKQLLFDPLAKKITGVEVATPSGLQTFGDTQDYYIAAVPVEVVQKNAALFTPVLKQAAGLVWSSGGEEKGVDKLETDWMSGVLFYMKREVTALRGHIVHATSPWALTSITQGQFWKDYPWAQRGNGQARDILSAIISDWARPGDQTTTKPAKDCTKAELLAEVWEQLRVHLQNEGPPGAISAADKLDEFLDPAISFDAAGKVQGNAEPLLVNVTSSQQHRPSAKTQVANFFVAADYVKTNTDLACMEAANEAARHAVNGLITASGKPLVKCEIRTLKEPAIFELFRQKDEIDYLANPAGEPFLCRHIEPLLDRLGGVSVPSGLGIPTWVWSLAALGAALIASAIYAFTQN